jgi:hypothetical protein
VTEHESHALQTLGDLRAWVATLANLSDTSRVDGSLNIHQVTIQEAELAAELEKERAHSRKLFTRAEAAENALYDAQRGWRERVSDWWLERRGGGI